MTNDDATREGGKGEEEEEREEDEGTKEIAMMPRSSPLVNEEEEEEEEERQQRAEVVEKEKKSKRIAVYLRLKPPPLEANSGVRVEHGDDENGGATKTVSFKCDDDVDDDEDDGEEEKTSVARATSKKYAKRGSSQIFTFFDEILDENASQEDTFDTCARNVVMNCLDGVNGTIFAYGQTGSGKTHTITGGNDGAYENRGIIPRSLETVFREMEKRKREEEEKSGNKVVTFDATCEYVEVYNEQAYDLLGRDDWNQSSTLVRGGDASSPGEGEENAVDNIDDTNNGSDDEEEMFHASLDTRNNLIIDPEPSSSRNHHHQQQQQQHQLHLPRVYLQEDEKKTFRLKGISTHRIRSEEEAMNLLFVGDANRAVAETPLNLASSRSHCVFTITIEKRTSGDDTLQRAKLNIVDLAGSERVSKTKIDGSVLTEAKHINLSLHFLERVIVALQEQQKLRRRKNDANATYHVPYRNSVVTSMLRDSLGGNCNTVMIATCSHDESQLTENVATCRFAQRVSCVTNEYHVNQEIVPELVIKRLRAENARLIEELKALKEAYAKLERKVSVVGGDNDDNDDDDNDGKSACSEPPPVTAVSIKRKEEEEEEEEEEGEKDVDNEENDIDSEDAVMNNVCEQNRAEHPCPANLPRADDSEASSSDSIDDDTENFDLDYHRSLLFDKKLAFSAFLSSPSPHIHALSESITTNEQKKSSTLAVSTLVRERVLQLKLDFANLRRSIQSTRIQKEASRLNPSSEFSFSERAIHERKLLEQIKAKKSEHSNAVKELRELKGVVAVVANLIEKSRLALRDAFEIWFQDLERKCKRVALRRAEVILREDDEEEVEV